MQGSSETWNYSYDTNGLRTQRSNGTATYRYWYSDSGLLLRMEKGNTVYSFIYDAVGRPVAITEGNTRYFYVLNQQGDVVAIINGNGDFVVEYYYDAWGRLLSTTGTLATTLGVNNPLRYRSYIYDRETGLYYLQSRYYNPAIGRFINADGYIATGHGFAGFNMFAYCSNNPVMLYDPSGGFGFWTILSVVFVAELILSIPSSEQQKPTDKQIEAAEKAADRAQYTIGHDSAGNQTIHIHIDTKDAIDAVDCIARDHYYKSLHKKTVQMAKANNIPTDNLMTVSHIAWEFELHVHAYYLGIDSALQTDLDSDETPWSMFKRAMGW